MSQFILSMPACLQKKLDGHQCTRKASTKEKDDPRYCWQHQKTHQLSILNTSPTKLSLPTDQNQEVTINEWKRSRIEEWLKNCSTIIDLEQQIAEFYQEN